MKYQQQSENKHLETEYTSKSFVKCGVRKRPIGAQAYALRYQVSWVPKDQGRTSVETKKKEKPQRRGKRTPDQDGVQNKTFPLTSKCRGNNKQITVDRGVAVKIYISIASKWHKDGGRRRGHRQKLLWRRQLAAPQLTAASLPSTKSVCCCPSSSCS